MDANTTAAKKPVIESKGRRKFKETVYACWKNKNFMVGFVILLSVILVAIFADFLAPYDYTEQSGYNTTDYKGALVTDGVDDYGRTTAIDDEVGTMLSRLVPFASAGQRYYLDTSSYDSNSSPYRLYIWNLVADTPSISQGVKGDSGYVDNVWPYLSLVREPVSLGGRNLSLSSGIGGGWPTSMAFYHLILIRQKCTVEQVECLKWLMDKKYRDYIKNN